MCRSPGTGAAREPVRPRPPLHRADGRRGFDRARGALRPLQRSPLLAGAADRGRHVGCRGLLLSLPSVKQRQAGVPQMNLRNWGADGFVEDSWKVTATTTLNLGVRYEYSDPLYDKNNTNTNLIFQNGSPSVFVGGQEGYPRGLMYPNRLNFAPRLGIAKHVPRYSIVFHGAYGIFFTPVDQNTWCNQRHNVPYVFPETQQADNFTP